ncbi:MAG TPA: hypothetical protein VL134_05615 [Leptolyngbya sp.]|nr:hypothetical protein [Leptolyngbya sp.]
MNSGLAIGAVLSVTCVHPGELILVAQTDKIGRNLRSDNLVSLS